MNATQIRKTKGHNQYIKIASYSEYETRHIFYI
jgi:hypothetical protein